MMIHATVVLTAYFFKVNKLLYLGSSCIYPRECPQPIKDEYLLTNLFEPTNESCAIAKIAGISSSRPITVNMVVTSCLEFSWPDVFGKKQIILLILKD